MSEQRDITSNIDLLLETLPPHIQQALETGPDDNEDLLEVIMDLGRLPEARYRGHERFLSDREVSQDDIDHVINRIGAFGEDNRAGIPRTLHRISGIRNRAGKVIGLTCRVGRAVFGTIAIIRDLIESRKSILLLGKPGVGKTTMLRETARVEAEDLRKRVVIVDTSNEIAGDGDIPHPGIGRARRMQVPRPSEQHAVMIEAVENHMPEVIVIDEIGTELEALAARTIAERGVQLIGTAHGNTLDNLMSNPTLSDLIGGIQAVTLGDEEARRRGTQKTVLERKAPPTFAVLVEIQSWDKVSIHSDVAETVDSILRGYDQPAEVRELTTEGDVRQLTAAEVRVQMPAFEGRVPARRNYVLEPPAAPNPVQTQAKAATKGQRIYPFGISRKRLLQAIRDTQSGATVAERLDDADLVLTDRSYYRRKPQALREAESRGIPLYVLRNNALLQMQQALLSMQGNRSGTTQQQDPVVDAMSEAEEAIHTVMQQDRPV